MTVRSDRYEPAIAYAASVVAVVEKKDLFIANVFDVPTAYFYAEDDDLANLLQNYYSASK